jgi:type I restriction enzyme S subunit
MALTSLESVCKRVSSGGTPSRKNAEYFTKAPGGHLWVKSKELLDCAIEATEEHITDAGLNNSSAKYYPPNTVLVAMYGANVGQLGWLRKPATVNQAICGLVVDEQKADWRFVFYSLLLNRGDLTIQAQGAAQQNLNQDLIRQFCIELPPLPIQRLIASILSAYDGLIENSQRRIKILESMARALYREWFVHFRFPGHENHPRFASPLGEIPEGWDVGTLENLVVLQRGFDLPKSSRKDGNIPIIAATGVTGFHDEAKVKAPGVVTGRSGTIGEVMYIHEDFWPLNTALWAKEFPKSEPLVAYYLLSSLDLKQFNSGAAVPTLNRNDIHGIKVVIPPIELQRQFQQVAGGMHTQCRKLALKVDNLRRTRDLLLPRLLSGQIALDELEAA